MAATLSQVEARIRHRGGHEVAHLVPFAQQLFAKADEAFLDAFDADELVAMASSGLAWFDEAGQQDPYLAVEAWNPTPKIDGWASPHTVLRLALVDCPFIVESVRAEFRAQGFAVTHVLHPTFQVVRDGERRITEVARARSAAPAGARKIGRAHV